MDMVCLKDKYVAPESAEDVAALQWMVCTSPDEGCIEGLEIEDWVTAEE